MPVDVLSRLAGPVNAALGDNTVFTPKERHQGWIRAVKIVNNTTAKITIKVGINATTDDSLIFPAIPVPAKGMVNQETFDVLEDSDSLLVNASATGSTVTIMGYDRYPTL